MMSSASALTQPMSFKNSEIWMQTCTQGKYHVKMKAEIGMMTLQAKEHQRLPAKLGKQGEKHGTDSLVLRRNQSCNILILRI